MIVDTYIDEAGTHGSSPHLIMGGLVCQSGRWTYFDRRWGKMLQKNDLSYFHAKKWKDTDPPFAGWTRQKKGDLIEQANKVQQTCTLFGFTVMLRQSEYDEFYKAGEKPKKIPLDTMYGLCFRYCAIWIPSLLQKSLNRTDIENNFILESGHKNAGDALRVFNQLKKDIDAPASLRSLTFQDKKSRFGLQGADLVSHTFWLAEQTSEEEKQLTDFAPEGNLNDAKKLLGQNFPIFRGYMAPDILQEIKAKTLARDAERIEYGKRHRPKPTDVLASEALVS